MNAPDFYDTERALSEYLLFHYGTASQILPWPFGPATALDFAVRCVAEGLDPTHLPAPARALDLGCAVGRATFELARHCSEVIGIDYSPRFIAAGQQLQRHGSVAFEYVEEGRLTRPALATVPAGVERSRVTFEHGDALALRPSLGQFDVVLLANLLDRLREPRRCLAGLRGLVRAGGQAIITTPCTWLEDYTPREHWLGGFQVQDQPVRTLDTLRAILDPDFYLIQTRDLPFLIREHARKFQWSVALASTWIRR